MNLTPEIQGAIRILLMSAGGFAVGKGWVDQNTLTMVVGAIITLGVAFLSMRAKRAASKEAQIIAGRVVADPVAQPIVPPSHLDEKVKDEHL
jgi:uncharacterized membrane protein